ncbi:hypothetical protein METH_14830 [Leisingera methylohalidivorans DSM 14336]|uniref:Uncharacterized protein n=2 Tax=Leisingera methylohalidivorans TaxID=133924 RepID=V9VWL3_9RHOB|nr:hypothetical protein METH_14830 [Leisingera methylohalidivorans DSM 14336]
MSVTAAEPEWVGKSGIELDSWLSQRRHEDADERAARRGFINDANTESYGPKALAGLIPLPKTPEELKRDIARFSRHTDTAQRRHAFAEHLDLLADLDDGGGAQPEIADPGPNPNPEVPFSDGDMMD